MSSIDVYYYSIADWGFSDDTSSLVTLLDDAEKKRYQSFKNHQAQQCFLLGRWITKTQLGNKLEVAPASLRFELSELGKPDLPEPAAYFFSIAHCANAVAVAISSSAVGIDVECLSHRGEPWLKAGALINEEVASSINSLASDADKPQAFTRYWTCLEALVKLKGSSIYQERSSFSLGGVNCASDGEFRSNGICYQSFLSGTGTQLSLACASVEGRHGFTLHRFNGQTFSKAAFNAA